MLTHILTVRRLRVHTSTSNRSKECFAEMDPFPHSKLAKALKPLIRECVLRCKVLSVRP